MSASSNKTLWLIDDDSTFRYVFRCIVESHKLVDEFLEFENGADGYHALMNRLDPKQQPDFIMVDVSMPVLDGWGFLEKLWSVFGGLDGFWGQSARDLNEEKTVIFTMFL